MLGGRYKQVIFPSSEEMELISGWEGALSKPKRAFGAIPFSLSALRHSGTNC